jgi:arylsulfatase
LVLILGSSISLATVMFEPAVNSEPSTRIVFVVIDTLRADHLGAFGGTEGLSPALDGLSVDATVFTNAIATSSWTRPSIASMFTGRYPTSLGVHGRDTAIAERTVTIAELLAATGFQTLGVASNGNSSAEHGFSQGFDAYVRPGLAGSNRGSPWTAEEVTKKGFELLDGSDQDRPFFLFLHYIDPHGPYLPHPGLMTGPQPPGRYDGSRKSLSALDQLPASRHQDADLERIRHLYAGEVRYVDLWIGRLIDGLKERGLFDSTMLIVTSDHGEGLWDHGHRAHGHDLHDEIIRVPLILRLPGKPKTRGVRVDDTVSLVDLAPTILAQTNTPFSPVSFEGWDLTPLAVGNSQARRLTAVYAEMNMDARDFHAVRSTERKLIEKRTIWPSRVPRSQFYDLRADKAEKRNLMAARDATVAPVAKSGPAVPTGTLVRFRDALQAWQSKLAGADVQSARIDLHQLNEATVDSLEALGYIIKSPPQPSTETSALAQEDGKWVSGFFPSQGTWRWMSGRAKAKLDRSVEHTRWHISATADLDQHRTRALKIAVRMNGAPQHTHVVKASGKFVIEGRLPSDAGTSIDLEIVCDHIFVPADRGSSPDVRELCVQVESISTM